MLKFDNSPSATPTKPTVRDAAQDARQRGIDIYGEAGFARKCRLSRVLEYIASEECDGIERQLALCWLDSRGCGATPLVALSHLLNRLRAGED